MFWRLVKLWLLPKWDYEFYYAYPQKEESSDWLHAINISGEWGWELVAVVPMNLDTEKVLQYSFKRRKF